MKLKALLMKAARNGVAQVLGTILFLGGVGIGVSMILGADTYANYSTLKANFVFASPVAWGTAFLIASLALLVTVYVEPAFAQLPALILGVVFIAFGLLALLSATSPLVWAFVALGWVSIFTQIICWAEDSRATIYRYQPN